METCTRLSAAGVTPGMRLACPMVTGRTRSSFSRISRESPLMALYSSHSGMRDAFRRLELFDGLLLLIEIAGELDFGLDRPRLVADTRARSMGI